jgi:hypothetical protein
MKRTSKTKRAVPAESIARLADNGKDISSYFTNRGKIMPPLESVTIDVNRAVSDQITAASQKLGDYRECTRTLMHRVHRSDLVYEFFFVFSRFEHSLLVTNFIAERNGTVVADWDKFASTVNESFNFALGSEVEKAVRYYEEVPPKKQVLQLGRLAWKNVAPETKERLGRLLVLIRRVRNNLFHGEKFGVLLEGDSQRDADLLEHGLTILYACLWTNTEVKEKFYSEAKWELEGQLEEEED